MIGTPAASRFSERLFTRNRNADGHVEFARVLLDGCLKRHPECRAADTNEHPEMPTRVLDIGRSPGSTRLVQTRYLKLREPYVVLSYCWGQVTPHTTMLRDDNISSLLEFIDEEALTTTHRECIAIARQLGIRYVWIDALCIIQGNYADWDYESKRMAQVYGNATLSIIAGRAADSHTGFTVNKIKQIVPPAAISLGDNMGDIFLSLPRSMSEGPVSKRGWCFQEKVLSRRTFCFAEEQVYFSCQRSRLWEDGNLTMQDSSQLQIGSFPSPPEDIDINTGARQQEERDRLRTQMLHLWYSKILSEYTIRKLTNPHDIFAAVSSIAQLARNTIRSRYLAGIWEVDIVRGLLWCTGYSVYADATIAPADFKIKPKKLFNDDRAPSWSVSTSFSSCITCIVMTRKVSSISLFLQQTYRENKLKRHQTSPYTSSSR